MQLGKHDLYKWHYLMSSTPVPLGTAPLRDDNLTVTMWLV